MILRRLPSWKAGRCGDRQQRYARRDQRKHNLRVHGRPLPIDAAGVLFASNKDNFTTSHARVGRLSLIVDEMAVECGGRVPDETPVEHHRPYETFRGSEKYVGVIARGGRGKNSRRAEVRHAEV